MLIFPAPPVGPEPPIALFPVLLRINGSLLDVLFVEPAPTPVHAKFVGPISKPVVSPIVKFVEILCA